MCQPRSPRLFRQLIHLASIATLDFGIKVSSFYRQDN